MASLLVASFFAFAAAESEAPPPGVGPYYNNCTDCFPTLFPKWEPVWKLDRSTIAMPCNYSGWMDPELMAQFGVVSFDWANHQNSYRARASEVVPGANDTLCGVPHPPATCAYPTQEDLITQAEKVKAIDNSTRTWVYRQGQGAPLSWTIGQKYFGPGSGGKYDGFLLESVGCPPGNSSCGALPKGTRVGTYDFRNETLIDWFVSELIGGKTNGMGNPAIDGMYIDDVAGLGSPGTPDASPVFKQSGLSSVEAAKWNAGQRRAVVRAQAAAVNEHQAFTWQNLQPMGTEGGSGMVSPSKASCINGGPNLHTGKGFVGLRKLCTSGSKSVRPRPPPTHLPHPPPPPRPQPCHSHVTNTAQAALYGVFGAVAMPAAAAAAAVPNRRSHRSAGISRFS